MWKEEGKSFCLYWTELFVDCMSTTVIPEHTLLMWGDSLAPWKRGFLDSGFKFQTGPGSVYPGQSRGCMDIQHRYLVPSQGFFFWYSYSKVARIQDSNYAFPGPRGGTGGGGGLLIMLLWRWYVTQILETPLQFSPVKGLQPFPLQTVNGHLSLWPS